MLVALALATGVMPLRIKMTMTIKMILIQTALLSHDGVFAKGDGTRIRLIFSPKSRDNATDQLRRTAPMGRKKLRFFRTALMTRADLFQVNRGVGVMVGGHKGEETLSIALLDRVEHKLGAPGALQGLMRTR